MATHQKGQYEYKLMRKETLEYTMMRRKLSVKEIAEYKKLTGINLPQI